MRTTAAPQPTQRSLLADDERVQHPWKRTTGTSRTAVRVLEGDGELELRRQQVTRVIRALANRRGQPPTADEIAAECFRRGYIKGDHPDYVKPRLTELDKGKYIYAYDQAGHRTRRGPIGGGIIEKAGKRKSERSGLMVHTWRVVEIGTGRAVR